MADRDDTYTPQALLLDCKGSAHSLDGEAFERWRPEDGPLWIRLDEDSERDRAWLGTESGLGKDDSELFLRGHGWPRIRIPGPEQLFVLVRTLQSYPDVSLQAALLRFWIEPRRVITMSPRGNPHLQHLLEQLDAAQGPNDIGALLLLVTDSMADQLADAVLKLLRPVLVDLELAVEQRQSSLFDRVHRLVRNTSELRSYADPQRTLLLRLRSRDLDWLTKDHSNGWRTVTEYYNEASRELDMIVERSENLESSLASRTSEQINRRIYTLTVISTIMLPMSFTAGLLGTNVSTVQGNILNTQHPLWFIGLCIGLALLGWGIYVVFRRLRFL